MKQKSNNIQKMKHECRKTCYKMNFEKKISKNETEKRIYSRKELENWTCGNATCYKMAFEYFFRVSNFSIFFHDALFFTILKCNEPRLLSPIHMHIFHRYESSFRIVTVHCTVYTLFGNSVWMQYVTIVIYLCMYTETISEKRWMDRERERGGAAREDKIKYTVNS